MPIERFYLSHPLIQDEIVSFQKEEFHHLAHVVRIKPKETVEVINGQGSLAKVKIEMVGKNEAQGKVEHILHAPSPSYELILAQALPRQPRLEYIIEKSVELGVTQIWLFPGKYSEKPSLSPSQQERVFHIVISAMKQCGRLYTPKVLFLSSLITWQLPLPKASFFGDTRPDVPSFLSTLLAHPLSSLLISIGPEKGFSQEEVLHMENALSMQGVALSHNILRTDTAALCSLSLAANAITFFSQ